MPGEDHFRHERHTDEIGAKHMGDADLRRRFKSRSGKPHIDAFASLAAHAMRRDDKAFAQDSVIGSAHVGEAALVALVEQRIEPREIDVVLDRDEGARDRYGWSRRC
jgi:hypothetical protein